MMTTAEMKATAAAEKISRAFCSSYGLKGFDDGDQIVVTNGPIHYIFTIDGQDVKSANVTDEHCTWTAAHYVARTFAKTLPNAW
jgi:hypothetical protein